MVPVSVSPSNSVEIRGVFRVSRVVFYHKQPGNFVLTCEKATAVVISVNFNTGVKNYMAAWFLRYIFTFRVEKKCSESGKIV